MLNRTKSVLLAASIGVIGIGQAQSQVIEWSNATGGDWTNALNWSPNTVPTLATEIARIALAGTYGVSYSGAGSAIGALELTNPDATLTIAPGGVLGISANSVNGGVIQLNPFASSANSVLAINAPLTIGGSGEIRMRTSADNAQITGSTLTNGASHTIRGVGQVFAPLNNAGRVAADIGVSVSGNNLELRSATTNSGRLAAANASILEIDSGTVVTQPAGEIVAENGGTVTVFGGSAVLGGDVGSEGSGFVQVSTGTAGFQSVRNGGDLRILPGAQVDVSGAGLTNDGQIDMNPIGSAANSLLNFAQSGAIDGIGTIRMRTSSDNSQIIAAPGQSITHGAMHTIRGVGRIDAPMTNDGTITADIGVSVSGNNLELRINDKVNNGLLSAEASSLLDIEAISIDQTGGGEIRAEDGGVVGFFGASSVVGGQINSLGTGFFDFELSTSTTLDGVELNGRGFVSPGGTTILAGTGITNNALVEMNPAGSAADSILTAETPVTIQGLGEIRMRSAFGNSQMNTTASGIITHGADHLIRGVGTINAALVNEGIIAADIAASVSGSEMTLQTEDKINNNTMSAEANSRLDIDGITVSQGPAGMILANNGTVTLGTGTRIEDGALGSTGTGAVIAESGSQQLSGVEFAGSMTIAPGSTTSVDSFGLTNNGVIQMNPNGSASNAVLDLVDAAIAGTGEIRMRTSGDNSQLGAPVGFAGTIGSGQLVRGVGRLFGDLTNNGEIRADISASVSGATLEVFTDSLTNNGDLTSRPSSTLVLDTLIDQSGGGEIRAEGGVVALADGLELVGGSLDASGALVSGQPAWGTSSGQSAIEGTALSGNGFVNAGHTIEVRGGTLTNAGTIDLNVQGSGADSVLLLPETTTFTGSGSVRLRTVAENARVTAVAESGAELINGAGHTVEGVGQVQVPWTNEGTVRPGFPFGIMGATAGFTQAAGGTFEASIGNNLTNGRLAVTGTATLGGSLQINVVPPAVLTKGFNHTIITADSVAGTFADEGTLLDGQLITRVVYSATEVRVLTRCLADVNLDGAVDPGDFTAWVAAYNAGSNLADQNLNGATEPGDFTAWIVNFNSGC
ncbi:MAG: hypothetical protein ACTS22_04330 [Phycisphaerales bacterium]